MRLVLDTNVLVAAFIARGTCNELLEHAALHHEIVLSPPILNELREVLTRKFRFSQREAREAEGLLTSRAVLVEPLPLAKPVCRDADDDRVLATALAGGCAFIVSGDRDLTDLGKYEGIRILTPTAFWRAEHEQGK